MITEYSAFGLPEEGKPPILVMCHRHDENAAAPCDSSTGCATETEADYIYESDENVDPYGSAEDDESDLAICEFYLSSF